MNKWTIYGLREARLAASMSKDPSTQVGACILDSANRIVSKGWNGFAMGVADTDERLRNRAIKYALILHAEENALAFAESWRLPGGSLYCWPAPSCAHCTSLAIQHGIARIVAPVMAPMFAQRWGENVELAQEIAREAGVEYILVLPPDGLS